MEINNRRKLLDPQVTIDDLLQTPSFPTVSYTSGALPIHR